MSDISITSTRQAHPTPQRYEKNRINNRLVGKSYRRIFGREEKFAGKHKKWVWQKTMNAFNMLYFRRGFRGITRI